MGDACDVEGEERNLCRVLAGKTERKRLEDLGVDGRILNGF